MNAAHASGQLPALKIAIHNHYAGQAVSETEFSKRICKAARRLGWETVEAASSVEITRFDPDFVIALHFRSPKLTKYPTYGSMVTPPAYFAHDDQFVKNILSYDGYLSSSDPISRWLRDLLYFPQKKFFITPWYITCQHIPYTPPQLGQLQLFYSGTNWDGSRYGELFQQLDKLPYTAIYGPANAWTHIHRSYRGSLPFDGVSILNALNQAGVGLCLHRKEHCDAATPSSRIFEVAASGAIAICQEHGFIRDVFGDSVLYLESTDDPGRLTSQIAEYMQWLANNPSEALNLSKRAYDIFAKRYTLERLLSDLAPKHEELCSRKGYVSGSGHHALGSHSVQLIVRVGDRGPEHVQRALDSIKSQSYDRVGAIVVQYKKQPYLPQLLDSYRQELPIQVIESPNACLRSTQLWDGLKAVSSEYFGILDDDDLIHPNHVDLLLQLLNRAKKCGVAYSGAIRVWEPDPDFGRTSGIPTEPAELAHFEPFDINRIVTLHNFLTSNAFIARSNLLQDLGDDPVLPVLEDLFLLLFLCQRTDFIFSYEATCEFYWRSGRSDNSVWLDRPRWDFTAERIRDILWKQSFHCTQNARQNLFQLESNLSLLEQKLTRAEDALARTEGMLDALTIRLNRYLDLPFISMLRTIRRALFRRPQSSSR